MVKRKSKTNLQTDTYLEYLFRKGVNLKTRMLTISGEVEGGMFRLVDACLSEFEARGSKPVTIRINSCGGSVYDALAIAGRIKRSKCKVITEGYGAIMSAATLILASGDTRRVSRMAWFMVHQASYMTEGKHSDIKDLVEQAEREEQEWNKWMAKFTKVDSDVWSEMHKKDTYLSAEQLKKLGVVDAII